MLEPCFNELSVFPLCADEKEVSQRVDTFVALLSRLHRYGVQKVRYENAFDDIELCNGFTLNDYCVKALSHRGSGVSRERNNAMFLYSMVRKPYMQENEEPKFFEYSDAKYVDKEGEEHNCIGLYVAHLLNSISVGFDNGIKSPCVLNLSRIVAAAKDSKKEEGSKKEEDPKKDTIKVEVIHLSNEQQCLIDLTFIDLMSNQSDLKVPKVTDEKPTRFTVPVHHGVKECQEHGKELMEDPYVKDILVSIPFEPSERNYIHRVLDDNSVEVRLHWTKRGYGLRLSTSGEDIVQTWWIAKHLAAKYG